MNEKPMKAILNRLFSKLSEPAQEKRSRLISCWDEIVGSGFSKRTKPRFAPNGNITVWVDDSTLAFELSRRYKAVLLKRLRNQFGEDEVKDIKFFVGQLR